MAKFTNGETLTIGHVKKVVDHFEPNLKNAYFGWIDSLYLLAIENGKSEEDAAFEAFEALGERIKNLGKNG